MLIESNSRYLLKKTRAKAKMYEYHIPESLHIDVEENISDLLLIAIGAIGNISADIVRNKKIDILSVEKSMKDLEFSSKFFDSFLNSKIDDGSRDYYYLLGAIAYYLCDRIGSAKVMASQIDIEHLDLETNTIDFILSNVLNDSFLIEEEKVFESKYADELTKIIRILNEFHRTQNISDISYIDEIRACVYESGTPLELLLIDALLAIILVKLNYSALNLMPEYSNIDRSLWELPILEGGLIQELWQAQRKLGELGIYSGKSGVIQMPTGSGKTKAISLIVYSAILASRSNFIIIVAPFRALCREITYDIEKDLKFDSNIKIDQLSDILKLDNIFLEEIESSEKTVLVLTPEKLLYLLHQRDDLMDRIGLIIFDEGHLFDDLQRGTSYELLVSAIRGHLNENVQKILISAVISNAHEVNQWLNGNAGVVASDNAIKTTEKQIAITDWSRKRTNSERFGYLYFLNGDNPEEEEFYVPRFVRITEINKLGRERKKRYFPEINEDGSNKNNDVAIFHGINLCINGGVAIFVGKKLTANKVLERILDIERRGYDIDNIIEASSIEETEKISKLISENYGEDNVYFDAAKKGVFAHHANISNGLRISIEYAMRKELISFIVCTSTLAQGVNLPIRYLIVSSLYQGRGEKIRVRDFHNLIGRAGRSGVYTEGSILLSETAVYNKRKAYDNWKWKGYKEVLNEKNAEACTSNILSLIRSVKLKNRDESINFKSLIKYYYEDPEKYNEIEEEKIFKNTSDYANELRYYHGVVMKTLSSMESFLMSYLNKEEYDNYDSVINEVLKNTLGYYFASEEEKQELISIVEMMCEYIVSQTENAYIRHLYSKSLQGVKINKEIESWVEMHISEIEDCSNELEMFRLISELIFVLTDSAKLNKINDLEAFIEIGELWIDGLPYNEIVNEANDKGFEIYKRGSLRKYNLDDVIEICDNGFGYGALLIITALSEFYSAHEHSKNEITELINQVSSNLRYGLPDRNSVAIYELGFADRMIAQKISEQLNDVDITTDLRRYMSENKIRFEDMLNEYPTVFIERLRAL